MTLDNEPPYPVAGGGSNDDKPGDGSSLTDRGSSWERPLKEGETRPIIREPMVPPKVTDN